TIEDDWSSRGISKHLDLLGDSASYSTLSLLHRWYGRWNFPSGNSIRGVHHSSIFPTNVSDDIPLDRPAADINVNLLGSLYVGRGVQLLKVFLSCKGETTCHLAGIYAVGKISSRLQITQEPFYRFRGIDIPQGVVKARSNIHLVTIRTGTLSDEFHTL